jgi:hypothetical protein
VDNSPSCKSCQFFTKPTNNTEYGLCVRFPVEVEHLTTHWCGEYRLKGETRLKEPLSPVPGRGTGKPPLKATPL